MIPQWDNERKFLEVARKKIHVDKSPQKMSMNGRPLNCRWWKGISGDVEKCVRREKVFRATFIVVVLVGLMEMLDDFFMARNEL